MIIYNVTVNIDASANLEWLKWMKEEHIPDVLKTGYFSECKMSKVMAFEEGGLTYSLQYTCESEAKLEEYQEKEAPRLQEVHTRKFQGKFAAFRTLLDVVEIFNP
jgi:hypothetical protein